MTTLSNNIIHDIYTRCNYNILKLEVFIGSITDQIDISKLLSKTINKHKITNTTYMI